MVWLHDALTLDAPRRTQDGYLAVRARAARTGVYQYAGHEVDPTNAHGLRDTAIVNVLRDEQTVFDERAVRSFIGKPVTDNHPTQPVTADNWRDHARGTIMGALRDGDYLAFDLMLTDADAIAKVNAGKRELSNGYAATLEFGQFTAADGTVCQARQSQITGGNHVALVDRGRAGPDCRIADGAFAACDANPEAVAGLSQEKAVKTITLDGLPVNLGDAVAVEAAIAKLQDKAAAAETALADANAKASALAGEKIALEAALADAKAELAPAKLDQRVTERAKLIADAKKIMPTVVTDAVSDADVRRAVVVGRLGEAAAGLDDSGIAGAFITMLSCEDEAKPPVQPIGAPAIIGDAAADYAAARAKHKQDLNNAWRQPAPAAA